MNEHSKFVTFTYIGGTFGTMITYPICGVVLDKLGWEAVFYLTGGLGILWFLVWQIVISNDPSVHCCISEEEKLYILKHRRQTTNVIGENRPPYLKILATPSVWGLMVCDFARSFGSYMVIIEGPDFIDKVLKKDILEVIQLSYFIFEA
jgi:ACS family sodium-dependent inorganic phosphate cotransporter